MSGHLFHFPDLNASADLRMIFFLFVNTVLIRISDCSRSCIFVYFIQSYWQINYFIYSFYFNYLIESIINSNYRDIIPSSLNSWIWIWINMAMNLNSTFFLCFSLIDQSFFSLLYCHRIFIVIQRFGDVAEDRF